MALSIGVPFDGGVYFSVPSELVRWLGMAANAEVNSEKRANLSNFINYIWQVVHYHTRHL